MGSDFFIIQHQDKGFSWRSVESFESLLDELMQPQEVYRPLEFDPEILAGSPYPVLYAHNKADVIQVFFNATSKGIEIYVLDEQGALFQQSLQADSLRFLMLQQRRFLNSLQQLRNLVLSGESNLLAEPEFFELSVDKKNKWQVKPKRIPLKTSYDYMEVVLVTDSAESDAKLVSLICGEREFSTLEYSTELYAAAANYINSHRRGGERYPIYLTSLRLSDVLSQQNLETVNLLNLKKRVEDRLNSTI
jgi:adenylate cyclase class 1